MKKATLDSIKNINKLIKENKINSAVMLAEELMNRKQYFLYKVYAAEQIINIYKKTYPKDQSLKNAIIAVKNCIKSNTNKNREAARIAAKYALWSCWDAALAGFWDANKTAGYVFALADTASRLNHKESYSMINWEIKSKKIKLKSLKYGIKLLRTN